MSIDHWNPAIICQTREKNRNKGERHYMEMKGCFYKDQFGYCWLVNDQWMFQAVDINEEPVGEPIKVELDDIVFHHEEDE
jgi:hypothetical protein